MLNMMKREKRRKKTTGSGWKSSPMPSNLTTGEEIKYRTSYPIELDEDDESISLEDSELEVTSEKVYLKQKAREAMAKIGKQTALLIKDSLSIAPNGTWKDHSFRILNNRGIEILFMAAEVTQGCFRIKEIRISVMTPQGYPVCNLRCKFSICRRLSIEIDGTEREHGSLAQYGYRPDYTIENGTGIAVYRVQPAKPMPTCYGWGEISPELFLRNVSAVEDLGKTSDRWPKHTFPAIYNKDVYKRTSMYGILLAEEAKIESWDRLLVLGLLITIKITRADFFYDAPDFAPGFGHPSRGYWQQWFGCGLPRSES